MKNERFNGVAPVDDAVQEVVAWVIASAFEGRVMASFLSWLKKTVETIVDPDKEERIRSFATLVQRELIATRSEFQINKFANQHELGAKEVKEICCRAYQNVVANAWRDGQVSDKERQTLKWVEEVLRIDPETAESIRGSADSICFGKCSVTLCRLRMSRTGMWSHSIQLRRDWALRGRS